MAIARVARASAYHPSGFDCTTAPIDTTGATLLVAVIATNTGTPPAIVDSYGNTWIGLTARIGTGSGNVIGRMFYVAQPKVGAGHTFSTGGCYQPSLCVLAYSGLGPVPFAGTENGAGGQGTSLSTGPVTPVSAGDLMLSAFAGDTATGVDALAFAMPVIEPFRLGVNYGSAMVEDARLVGTAATLIWTQTVTNINGIAVMLATFRAADAPVAAPGLATDYLENAWIDHVFRSRTLAKPTTLAIGLFTTAPGESGGGVEVTGGGYARATIAPGDTKWTATQGGTTGNSSGTSGVTTNAVAVVFPVPTAAWGTITHYGIFDAVTGGNLLLRAPLTTPRTVNLSDPAPTFAPGALVVTVA